MVSRACVLRGLSTSSFFSLFVGKRQAERSEGAAELIHRLWPDAMKLLDLVLTDLG